MAVKLELYRVFKEVAETGNISVAARNLYISQSAVSQSVKQLETALQARLFARSPRGVTLTGEGQLLYQIEPEIYQNIAERLAPELPRESEEHVLVDHDYMLPFIDRIRKNRKQRSKFLFYS